MITSEEHSTRRSRRHVSHDMSSRDVRIVCPRANCVTHHAPAVRVMLSNANAEMGMNRNQKYSDKHVTTHSPKMGLCKWLGRVVCRLYVHVRKQVALKLYNNIT